MLALFCLLTQKTPFSAFSRKVPFLVPAFKESRNKKVRQRIKSFLFSSRTTGIEPAAFDVTGQYSNQLSYVLIIILLPQAKRFDIITKQRINMKIVGCEKSFICLISSFDYFEKKDQDQSTKEKLHVDLLKAVNKKNLTYII